jgi:hypothetical protein
MIYSDEFEEHLLNDYNHTNRDNIEIVKIKYNNLEVQSPEFPPGMTLYGYKNKWINRINKK